MCTTRSWKSLEASPNSEVIIARRSDNIIIKLFDLEFISVRDFVQKLEEFRNCKCTQLAPCDKHKDEKERINA